MRANEVVRVLDMWLLIIGANLARVFGSRKGPT